jgi:hypothetical protein
MAGAAAAGSCTVALMQSILKPHAMLLADSKAVADLHANATLGCPVVHVAATHASESSVRSPLVVPPLQEPC